MRQNIHYWNEKTNNIILLSSVSLFLLKETNIHTISVLIYHGMSNVTRAAGAMPRRQTHMRVRDARISVLDILAHTVFSYSTNTRLVFRSVRFECRLVYGLCLTQGFPYPPSVSPDDSTTGLRSKGPWTPPFKSICTQHPQASSHLILVYVWHLNLGRWY
jgi:hypothetical protein